MVQEIGRLGHFLPHEIALQHSRALAEKIENPRQLEAAQDAAGKLAVRASVELQQAA